MQISYKKKFIFIHNWKAGGTSVRKALSPFALEMPTTNKIVNLMLDGNYAPAVYANQIISRSRFTGMLSRLPTLGLHQKHNTASSLKKKIPARLWDTYFKFGFVRNPWDREVSNYFMIVQRKIWPAYGLLSDGGTFKTYVQKCMNHQPYLQKWFFTDEEGKLLVDFVGRFENLEKDFGEVCNRIGISVDLPHENRTKRKSYKDYYDAETMSAVAEVYREDIEYFGYEY